VSSVLERSEFEQTLSRLHHDFVYFAPVVLKVRDKQTKRMVPMVLRPAQERLALYIIGRLLEGKPVRVLILKARQEGVSTLMQAIFYWLCSTRPDQLSLTISHHDDTTGILHGISEAFWINSPARVRPQKRYSAKSKEMVFANRSNDPDELARNPGLNSVMRTVSAKNAGAGQGVLHVHGSEVALWESVSQINAKEVLETLLQVVPDAPGTIVALESTARGVGNEFHRRWKQAERSLAAGLDDDFYPYFIPWMEEPEYDAGEEWTWELLGDLTDREERLRRKYSVRPGQIAWRRSKIRQSFAGDEDTFDQEYPESPDVAFLKSGRPFFDLEECQARIDELEAEPRPVVFRGEIEEETLERGEEEQIRVVTREHRKGKLRVWEAPIEDEDYVIVCDPSEGSDGDPQDVVVLKASSLVEVAGWHGHIDRGDLGDVLWRMGHLYNTALVSVERQGGWGLTPLNVLQRRGYPRIHRRFEEGKKRRKRGLRLGFDMTETNRALILDALREAVHEGDYDCPDVTVWAEMMTFVYGANGKPQADIGCHDDRVISRAVAVWLWQTERGLRRGRSVQRRPSHEQPLSRVAGY